MVSMRVFRYYLLISFVLQLHAEVSNANFNSQVPQTKNSEVRGASSTSTPIANMHAEDVIENRKTLKLVNVVNIEANEKNVLDIESKETVRKRKNKKRPTKTASLVADYSDPGHHSPRHN